MNILQINKFWFKKGGTETHLMSLISTLSKHGHNVFGFGQKNKNNIKINGDKYFVSEISLDKFYIKNIFKIGRIFWSLESKKNIKKLIDENKIDIVHIHNIYHQISPSILPVIKKANIPIVMTVHDFKLINPYYTLWLNKTKNNKSIPAKLIMKLEFIFHKLIKVYNKNIDFFIVPSKFVYTQLVNNGFDKNKIIILPHFVDKHKIDNKKEENYIISFCRLDASKGLDTLIRAIENTNINLKIVGSGPQEIELKTLATSLDLNKQIEFIPHLEKNKLTDLIAKAKFSVFPSEVAETFGLGIVESFLQHKPVVASKSGAFSENIDKNTGILFEAGNTQELKLALEKMWNNYDLRVKMSKATNSKLEDFPTSEDYYKQLNNIYLKAINK